MTRLRTTSSVNVIHMACSFISHKTNSHKRLTVSVFKRQKQPERTLLSTTHFFPRARGALLISLSERSVAMFSISTLIDSLNAAHLAQGESGRKTREVFAYL